jgi:hypothetical protein
MHRQYIKALPNYYIDSVLVRYGFRNQIRIQDQKSELKFGRIQNQIRIQNSNLDSELQSGYRNQISI